jgi:hypothetical protein
VAQFAELLARCPDRKSNLTGSFASSRKLKAVILELLDTPAEPSLSKSADDTFSSARYGKQTMTQHAPAEGLVLGRIGGDQ